MKSIKKRVAQCFLTIVFLFVLTHSFRLAFKFYEILIPNTAEQFERCLRINRYINLSYLILTGDLIILIVRNRISERNSFFLFRHHVPFVLYILLWLNNLVVVINSSLNFLIYCCVSESFRARTFRILGSKPSC